MGILNRLRGTYGYFAHINGLIIGLVFGLIFTNPWLGLALYAGYVGGESLGWGKWVGAICLNIQDPTDKQLKEMEGEYGIHQVADFFIDDESDYQGYARLALALRGMLWWLGIIAPLIAFGIVTWWIGIIHLLAVGVAFPYAFVAGRATEQKFNFKWKFFHISGHWEHGEVWYGIVQGISLLIITLSFN